MIKEFISAASPEEALHVKQEGGRGTEFLAGGTEINRLHSPVACERVVSLKNLHLDAISVIDDVVTIGALATFQSVLEHTGVPSYLREALSFCGSRTKRNMATIGGNVALCRDDSYLMPTLLAAKARLVLGDIVSDGTYAEEDIPIREYHAFREHFAESLILAIVLNKRERFVASSRFSRTLQSPAAVTVSFGADVSGASPHDVRICAAIKGSGVVRLVRIEEGVSSGRFPVPEDAGTQIAADSDFVDDTTGSAAYKRYLLGTAVSALHRRCLASVAKGGGAV